METDDDRYDLSAEEQNMGILGKTETKSCPDCDSWGEILAWSEETEGYVWAQCPNPIHTEK